MQVQSSMRIRQLHITLCCSIFSKLLSHDYYEFVIVMFIVKKYIFTY